MYASKHFLIGKQLTATGKCLWNLSFNFKIHDITSNFTILFFFEFQRERGRERGKHQCERETLTGWLWHAPQLRMNLQPRHVPWLGIKLTTFQLTGDPPTDWTTLARALQYIFPRKTQGCFFPKPLSKNWNSRWCATFTCGFSYPDHNGRSFSIHAPGREALTLDFEPTFLSLAFEAMYNLILVSFPASVPPHPTQPFIHWIGRRFAALDVWITLLCPNQRFSPL